MDTDRNLLFGVLALQADLLDPARFAEACAAWASRKGTPLAALLRERGWITAQDQAAIEHLLLLKLNRYGSPQASLAAAAGPEALQALSALDDPDIRHSLAGAHSSPGLRSTIDYRVVSRQRYVLTRLHARGGIGQVWLAHDPQIGRDIALKELRPERAGEPHATARFLQEARVTGRLEHPGIVPLYELNHRPEDGQPFYAMRFLKGRTLADACADYHRRRQDGRAGPLELRELLAAFLGVCNAVAYAHARGVIHRDLKPANVALGDFGEVIVLDWGLAKVLGAPEGASPAADGHGEAADQTRQGQVLGTPGYMPPEQAAGRPDLVDERSDVYSLGAILYQVLAGEPPFAGQDTQEILRRSVEEPPRPPRELAPAAPRALEAVCLKALAKDPAARYPTAAALADEVRHWLADEPVTAYPEPWTTRARRWLGRHRSLVSAAAAALLVALVGLAAATGLLAEANASIRDARDLAVRRQHETQQQRDLAEDHFRLAREAVEEYCTKVSDDPRLKEKDLEGLRKELLRSAVKFHKRLTERRAGDSRPQADLGRSYRELALLTGETGDKNEAIAFGERAVALFEGLAGRYPESADHAEDLGRARIALGRLYDETGKAERSREILAGTITALEAARQRHGASEGVRKWLALAHSSLGGLLDATLHRPQEAVRSYQRAIALYKELADAFPEQLEYAARLGGTYGNRGTVAFMSGKPQEAVVWYEKSITILEGLRKRHPEDQRIRMHLAGSCHGLGAAYGQLGRPDDAVRRLRQSLAEYQAMADAHPGVTYYQQSLARTHQNLGVVYLGNGDRDKAAECIRQGVAIKRRLVARNPEVPDFEADLCRGLHSLTRFARDPAEGEELQRQAQERLTALVARHPGNLLYRSDLAHGYFVQGELCRAKDPARAAAAYREAVRRFADLTASQPVLAAHPNGLWLAHHHLAQLLLRSGQLDQATEHFGAAEKVLQGLAEKRADNTHNLTVLTEVYREWVEALRRAARHPQAAAVQERALPFFDRLVAAAPDKAAYQIQRLIAHTALGEMYQQAGKFDLAGASYRKVLALEEEAAPSVAEDADYQFHLALSRLNLGVLNHYLWKKPAEAAALYGQALELGAKLFEAEPNSRRLGLHLATVHLNLGALHEEQGRLDDAVASYRRCAATLDKLDLKDAALAKKGGDLGAKLNALGLAYARHGKSDSAAEAYREGQALLEKVVAAQPKVAAYAVTLAGIYCNHANLLREGDGPKEALPLYERAVGLLKAVRQREPKDTRAPTYLRNTHWGRALALERLDRHREALADWDEAVRQTGADQRAPLRLSRAGCLARAGEHARAAAEVEEVVGAGGASGAGLYNAALALTESYVTAGRDTKLSQAERQKLADGYARRAVGLLAKAAAAGYFNDPRAAARLRGDAALRPLRDREDYRKLLQGLGQRDR